MPKEIKNIINASKYTLLFEPKYLWLKTLLFEVIETQAGRSILNDFKTISHFTHCYRDTQNEKELSNLNRYFLKLSSKKKHIIIKSFRLFFELYNLLEDGYRCDLNTIKEKESGQGSLEILIKNARKKRIPLKQLLKTLNSSLCQLIWTAHPTETHSLSSLRHLQAIIPLLKSYKENLLDSKKEKLAIQLKTHITHLWQSHSVSSKKMHVLDELRRTLFYLEHNFTSALTELYQTLSMNLKRHYKHILAPKELSPFLGLGFWPGGDRDGNPYVTATISKQALLLIKRSSMRILLEQIELLIKQLSNSTNQIQVSLSLKRSINQDIKTFPVFSKRTETLNTDEPYRKKLDFMRLKCLNTLQRIDQNARNIGLSETLIGNNNDARPNQTGPSYTSLEPFIDELYIIADSLNKNKGSIITQNNLNPLLFLAQVLARISLDFRQHSDHHQHCIKN